MGVSPVLEARDLANPNVEYLGVMAWAAQFQVPSKPQHVEYLGVMAWAAQFQIPSKPQR